MENKKDLNLQLDEKEKALVQRELKLKEKESLIKSLESSSIKSTEDFTKFKNAFRNTIKKYREIEKSQSNNATRNSENKEVSSESNKKLDEIYEHISKEKYQKNKDKIKEYIDKNKEKLRFVHKQAEDVDSFLDDLASRISNEDEGELEEALGIYEEHFQSAFDRFKSVQSTSSERSSDEGSQSTGDLDLSEFNIENEGSQTENIETPPQNLEPSDGRPIASLNGLSDSEKKEAIKRKIGL